ncbi:hypothetical protein RCCGE510_08860 [Rhizobium sp. CCGE 510]|nr:hypothetical protein RCCGE510_08860 [Rhizobium sp. CCGE 510]
MRLVWARYALSDRDNIFTYIEIENPRAAVHVDQKIVFAVPASSNSRKAEDRDGSQALGSW